MKLQKISFLFLLACFSAPTVASAQFLVGFYHGPTISVLKSTSTKTDSDFGIKEIVPREYQARYDKWKQELFKTEFGRRQWEAYGTNQNFLLKIVVTGDKKFGAGTGDFKWDNSGRLVGATITLGKNIDKGFPDPVYYPVMNSLFDLSGPLDTKGNILASAKIAHEFGHVDLTARANGTAFQLEDNLMSAYYKIFLNNGYDTADPQLVKLAGELGRQPMEIWEDREYWGEANAMRYIVSRINKEGFFCSMLGNIMRNVTSYARPYEARFDIIAGSNVPAGCRY